MKKELATVGIRVFPSSRSKAKRLAAERGGKTSIAQIIDEALKKV